MTVRVIFIAKTYPMQHCLKPTVGSHGESDQIAEFAYDDADVSEVGFIGRADIVDEPLIPTECSRIVGRPRDQCITVGIGSICGEQDLLS